MRYPIVVLVDGIVVLADEIGFIAVGCVVWRAGFAVRVAKVAVPRNKCPSP